MADKKYMSPALPFSVIAVFAAANGLIRAPFSGGSLWGFSAALLSGVCLLPLSFVLFDKIPFKRNNMLSKAVFFAAALFCLLPAVSALKEYCEFVYRAVLPHGDMRLIAAMFIICVLYLAKSDDTALFKFAFLSFLLIAAVFGVLFFMSAKTFDAANLPAAFDIRRFSFKDAGEYFLRLVLPSAAATLYLKTSPEKISGASVLCGAAAGAFLCIIAVFDSVLSFGLPLAAKLDYPYIDDISTVTVGSLFTRMDAFAYFAFFAAYVLKCALCIKISARLIRFTKKSKIKKLKN